MRSLVIPAGFEPAFFWVRARRDSRYSKGPLYCKEPPAGFEPTYPGYDAGVLPLDDGGRDPLSVGQAQRRHPTLSTPPGIRTLTV